MQLTIDNLDGQGTRDYTAALDAARPPRILRRLNRPAEMRFALLAPEPSFVVPRSGGRVIYQRRDGTRRFTGYVAEPPAYEFLGWGERGPVYRYRVLALSDEHLLDRKPLPPRPTFVSRSAGHCLRALAALLASGAFDTSAVQDLATLPFFSVDMQQSFSQHAAQLGLRSRATYRAHDGALAFTPLGATVHTLSEADESFSPAGLRLRRLEQTLNDVTLLGRIEPRAHVKSYFLGDGFTLNFQLSHMPFNRSALILMDEEYRGDALDPVRWQLTDPAAAVSVSAGKLHVAGGTGSAHATRVVFVEDVELGGALTLQHGSFTFSAASDAILGGLYDGDIATANCLAGFRATPNSGQSDIQALIQGVPVGPVITTATGFRYALTTRIYASQVYRRAQSFHSSQRGAGDGYGGEAAAADVRFVLEAHVVNPADPATHGAPAQVLFDGVVANAPAWCAYALISAATLHASISFTRYARAVDCEVRTALPGQPYRTRLVGFINEGAECRIFDTPELHFLTQYVPNEEERIVVRYRGRGRALARIVDEQSIAAHAGPGDDGVRAGIRRLQAPAARSAQDCERAALALLDDSTQPAWAGEYETLSTHLPGAAADILPGDALTVDVPSQQAEFTALVREVELEAADLLHDVECYKLTFANDAAAPAAFEFDPARLREPLDVTATTTTAGETFLADLTAAEITSISSIAIEIDAGQEPPSGGGIEVRHSDFGWGPEHDRNLAGRFTTRNFSLPRLTRVEQYSLRQFDSAGRYSRYSTVLHIDYPF